ncbi:MAG: PEGA domain-containing protein [Myxococcales bacterium]|nr:PEGA domain-containing protein [Myxococcales bacterium]
MSHHAGWIADEDDMTLTVPLVSVPQARSRREEEATDIVVHPDFAADVVTEELPMTRVVEYWSAAAPAPAAVLAPVESFPKIDPVPFSPAPILPRSHSEISLPAPRARLDSDTAVSTWRKTIPALRRMVGLPVVPGWAPPRAPIAPALPRPNQASTPKSSWSPVVLGAMAVCLVAMVVMTIVGFGSRAAEASRLAHIRVVSAFGTGGTVVTDGTVFVDGSAECESTPCELELTTGVHWITVRAPGYETPPSRSINAGTDEPTEVVFQLVPASQPAPVTVAPAPAAELAPSVVLGAAMPSPPRALAPVPAPAQPAHPAPAVVRSAAAPARLNLNAVPAANVVLDGRPVGRTPLMGLKVSPGGHTIVFIGPEGARAVRSTVVGAGRTVTVGVRL